MAGKDLRRELERLGDPERAVVSQRYFKTFPGGYGHGDIFLGISMPRLRSLAGKYAGIADGELLNILRSKIHEERMLALLILVRRFSKSDAEGRAGIFELYLRNTSSINNWDLVDVSAPHIVGGHLLGRDKAVLYRLAASESLWERRIALLATLAFIREHQFEHTFEIAKALLNDREDLIHKAAGWMLREVGKRDMDSEAGFLNRHYRDMPRTMLRYAIERFPRQMRDDYLKGRI